MLQHKKPFNEPQPEETEVLYNMISCVDEQFISAFAFASRVVRSVILSHDTVSSFWSTSW